MNSWRRTPTRTWPWRHRTSTHTSTGNVFLCRMSVVERVSTWWSIGPHRVSTRMVMSCHVHIIHVMYPRREHIISTCSHHGLSEFLRDVSWRRSRRCRTFWCFVVQSTVLGRPDIVVVLKICWKNAQKAQKSKDVPHFLRCHGRFNFSSRSRWNALRLWRHSQKLPLNSSKQVPWVPWVPWASPKCQCDYTNSV